MHIPARGIPAYANAASRGEGLMSPHGTVAQISPVLRWMRFNAVGIGGFTLQLALLKVFVSVLRIDPVAASVLAVEVVIIHNFFWHERFTWRERVGSNRLARW